MQWGKHCSFQAGGWRGQTARASKGGLGNAGALPGVHPPPVPSRASKGHVTADGGLTLCHHGAMLLLPTACYRRAKEGWKTTF